MNWNNVTLTSLYAKRDNLLHQVSLLLEDIGVLEEIGGKSFFEFENEVLRPCLNTFGFIDRSTVDLYKYKGHRISLIKFYCDTFNLKDPETEKRSLADLHQHE